MKNKIIVPLLISLAMFLLVGCKAFEVEQKTLIDYRYTPSHSYSVTEGFDEDKRVVAKYEKESFELLWLYTYADGHQERHWETCTRFEYQKAKEELGEVEP